MIFTALGALVVAGAFLIAGIAKSSVALLIVSLVCTAVAGFLLLATTDIARRRTWPQQGLLPVVNGGAAAGTPVVMYLPAPAADGHAAGGGPPVAGYEAMSAEQVVKLVGSGALGRDQLAAVRAYEVTGAARKTVLDRIDRAMRSTS